MESAAARGTVDNHSKAVIGWLELAVSSKEAIAAVRPMTWDEHQQCCGVTVGQRWLCGSDGTLTCFNTVSAATRFLNLLQVDRIAQGGRHDCNESERDAFQCFKLGARGILPCNKCHSANPVA